MAYLHFDKIQMTNLQESLNKEFLITNHSGAYCSSTLVGCNTRKYHGLFVVPISEMDDENHVLLSSLDETIIQHGAEFTSIVAIVIVRKVINISLALSKRKYRLGFIESVAYC